MEEKSQQVKRRADMDLRRKNRNRVLDMTMVSLFCVLMIVSAKISLVSFPVPLTFQLPMAVLSGTFLGWKRAIMTQALYLFMGLAGLPVFASGGGLSYIYTPTFGFLLGFVACAFVGGIIFDRFYRNHFTVQIEYALYVFCGVVAVVVSYMCGTAYMYIFFRFFASDGASAWTIGKVFGVAVLPFIWKDLLLVIPVVYLSKRLKYLSERVRS